MKVGILGVGTSKSFAKQPKRTPTELVWEAVSEAHTDAGEVPIEAVYVGSVYGEMGIAQRTIHALGWQDLPIVRVENACASGSTALHEAYRAVQVGRYEGVLAVGVDQMTSHVHGAILPDPADPEGRSGRLLPALYALGASRYLATGRATIDQMAAVAVKNRQHGSANERAQFQTPVTSSEVLESRPIASPLTLLQCSPVADGAAAAVVGPVRKSSRDVEILACELQSGRLWGAGNEQPWGYGPVQRVATVAYDAAGVAPEDIDVLEIHDAFTIGELITLEALGIYADGAAGPATQRGLTRLGGALPVNPSGGLIARGHPLGATGLAQVAEIVWQLTGRAGPRQVPNCRIGLVETMGGGVSSVDGNACVVSLLAKMG